MVGGKRVERGEEPRRVVETGGETVSLALQPRVADDGRITRRSVEPRVFIEPDAATGRAYPRLRRAVDRSSAVVHAHVARLRS
jgi:hypothetical protein